MTDPESSQRRALFLGPAPSYAAISKETPVYLIGWNQALVAQKSLSDAYKASSAAAGKAASGRDTCLCLI